MGLLVSHSSGGIVFRAREKLGLTQKEMADAIGSSLRTVSRWEGGESSPADFHLHKVAALLHSRDPGLARQAALAGGRTLEQLGIVKPPPPLQPEVPAPVPAPPTGPPSPPPLPIRLLVDAVVCAVASALEALEGAPVSMVRARTAVAAAFTSARDLRLGIDEAADAVAPAPANSPDAPVAGEHRRAGRNKDRRGRR